MTRALLTTLAISATVLLAAVANAAPDPKDEPAFTRFVAEKIRQIPDATATITGERTIEIKAKGRTLTASLDNLVVDCLRSPADCDATIERYVRMIRDATRVSDAQLPDKSDIRVVVRSNKYVEEVIAAAAAANKPTSTILKKLEGDLWLVCVIDRPDATTGLTRERAAAMGLSPEQAVELGKKNLQTALRAFATVVKDLPPNGIGIIDGDFYESSRLLLHDQWSDLSKKYNGGLVVAVPSPDTVIYGDGSTPRKRAAIQTFANERLKSAPRALSSKLLRWTQEGWQALPD